MPHLDSQYPHCDCRVLHAPGECEYCDRHPDWQELRQAWGINFTGHAQEFWDEERKTGKMLPCPAAYNRGPASLNSWHGNLKFRDGNLYPLEVPKEEDRRSDFTQGPEDNTERPI